MGANCAQQCCCSPAKGDGTVTPSVMVQADMALSEDVAHSMSVPSRENTEWSAEGESLTLSEGGSDNRARSWRDEWVAVRMREMQLQGMGSLLRPEHMAPGGPGSIDSMTIHLEEYIQWQVNAGWPREHAEAYTLLAVCARAALGADLREKSGFFPASLQLVRKVLSDSAKRLSGAAPPAYRNLSGLFGLATEDPAWEVLAGPEVVPGITFTTSSIVAGYRGRAYFRDTEGFYVGVNRKNTVVFEVQNSDVVCFQSAEKDAMGFHSLIQAAEGTYDLPPGAVVKLLKVEPPGSWMVYGKHVKRRLLVVSVTYP
eukprot:gnl/TRDRNA2_/TRDRNA2_172064_c0_seq1.p1 gnl/TRDRNA2_/TRDRNA2_172064_c0~~gnl/TRDRNA2_/TRDRNA2_172064_c0_seq1.p1  ORF type:complete len:313 (+),score=41.01 gnl/TRDRNA2_/TRDRNA2_172064_c0_seq1:79-1017(+)